MRRRQFIAALGAVATWPLDARAAAEKGWVIGYISVASESGSAGTLGAFRQGLREQGYNEGRDYRIEHRYTDGLPDGVPVAAKELVAMKPEMLVVTTTYPALAARALTREIPILCPNLIDPVRAGLADSIAKPGKNVTGLLNRVDGLAGKQTELLAEAAPDATTIGYLLQATSPNSAADRQEIEAAARTLRRRTAGALVKVPEDLPEAVAAVARAGAQALIIPQGGIFLSERRRMVDLISGARIPALYGMREQVDAGGLMSYGVNLNASWRRLAAFVAKIVNGTPAGDIPIEFATKVELVINLKTAKALGLAIPPTLLATADQVIE